MIRLAGIGRSGERGHHQPPPAVSLSSSSSTLSALAPPFTVDRWSTFMEMPNSLPLPPPACSMSPYFVPTGDSAWPPSSSGASKLSNLDSGSGGVETTRYYPYYVPAHDSLDGSLEKLSNYKGYVGGGWSGTFDLEEGRPTRGSVVNSSWMESLASCQTSFALKRKGAVDSFSTYEDSFGSWHGAHNESSSTPGYVRSELLDGNHREIYVDKNKALNDGSFAAELDTTVWPNEGSSYFYAPETLSVGKECCDTFIPSSYDRYVSQLITGSRDPVAHSPAQTSLRQGFVPSNERNESMLCCVLDHGNSANLHIKNDDYEDYTIGVHKEASLYENSKANECLEKMDISCDAMLRNRGNPASFLPINGLPSENSSALGPSIDCLQDAKFGFEIANISFCNGSNSERAAFIPDGSMQTSQEIPDHLNVAVDSPCWKGASVSRQYPFSSDEILQPLVIDATSGSDDLIQGQSSLKIQSDIEHGGAFACNENGEDIDMSPVTDLSGLDLKFQDCAERKSNTAKVENSTEVEQCDIHGEHNSVLNERECVPRGIDDHVRQLSQVENIICKTGSNTIETIAEVQNSNIVVNHISTSPNCSSSSSINASNGEMNLSSLNTISPAEHKSPVSSDATSKCLSQGQDARVLVKAMLSLSEVLLCHYFSDNEALEECDLKPVQQIIDNLEAVILQNKKRITGSSSRALRAEETQSEVKESNAEMSSDKGMKGANKKKNTQSSGINNEEHDDIVKSFSTNFKVSDGVAQEEDPKLLLYKNLWVQTEATLCSLKHDVALIKLELGRFKHHFKAKSQISSDELAEHVKDHQGLNCGTSISVDNPSRSNTQVKITEKNHEQCISKEDETDASVFARFRILKSRDEAEKSRPDEPQELDAIKSYVEKKKVVQMKELPPMLADVSTIEKEVLQSYCGSKFTVASPKNTMASEKLPALDHRMGSGFFLNNIESAGVQESNPSASDVSVIQSYNPKCHGKWLFSSGSGSPSSEWEHVLKDEFMW